MERTPFKTLNMQSYSSVGYFEGISKNFPANFNPRKDLNLHHQEKVDKWIVLVPTYPSSRLGQSWDNSCYSPAVGLSDSNQDEDYLSADYDFGNFQDVLEFQSHTITFQSNRLYFSDSQAVKRG